MQEDQEGELQIDNLAIAIARLETFSDVPGIAVTVEELKKPLTPERIEALRNPLKTLLDLPFTDQLRKNNGSLADAIHKVLLELAVLCPTQKVCPITFDELHEIPANHVVYVSSGEFFNLFHLAAAHHARPLIHTPPWELKTANFIWDESAESKWLVNPLTTLPFRPKDVEHIQRCCQANGIDIFDLRISQQVCDQLANPIRHLPSDVIELLNIRQGLAIGGPAAQGANRQIPIPIPAAAFFAFSSFPQFAAFLNKIDDATKPVENVISRTTILALFSGYVANALMLPPDFAGGISAAIAEALILPSAAEYVHNAAVQAIRARRRDDEPARIIPMVDDNIIEDRPAPRRKRSSCWSGLFRQFFWTHPENDIQNNNNEQPRNPANEDNVFAFNQDGNLVRRRRPGYREGDID